METENDPRIIETEEAGSNKLQVNWKGVGGNDLADHPDIGTGPYPQILVDRRDCFDSDHILNWCLLSDALLQVAHVCKCLSDVAPLIFSL